MTPGSIRLRTCMIGLLFFAVPATSRSQTSSGRPTGNVSVHVTTAGRNWNDGNQQRDTELSTGVSLESPRSDENGVEYGLNLRHTRYASGVRPDRLSLYDGFAGGRFGEVTQVRVRAGHMWLQDLGTIGSLAGGLVEVGHRMPGTERLFRVGFFTGLEPKIYETGYAPDVRKLGGYGVYESGSLRRHVVGYTTVKHGPLTERSVLSVTNYIPGGQSFFAYQAAEFEVQGPADGAAPRGLSYFLTNVRVTPSSRIDINGTYNRGRSLDARQLTDDLISGRPLTPQAVEGLQYESAGARLTVQVVRGVYLYGGYTRDRTNRDDAATGRVTVGGHAGNVFGTGFDLSGSDSRINRPDQPYHSTYLSVGHSFGRSTYVSGDYSTSLSVVRFLRSDGVVIETRPSTRRFSGSGSVSLSRSLSLLATLDYTLDEQLHELRILTGLSYRIR